MSIKNSPYLEEYRQELKKVWKDDQNMVDFCVKNAQSLIKLSGGQLFVTDKPNLDTEFCFGYSSCGQGPTYDECEQTRDNYRKHKEEWFKDKNVSKYDSLIEDLEKEDVPRLPYLTSHYWPEYNANIVAVTWIREGDLEYRKVEKGECSPLSDVDRKAIIQVYKSDREDMLKRCDSYIKRFGTKHLRSLTYWIDE